MAGFITFDISNPESTWSSANWVYSSFLDHAIDLLADDSDAVRRLTSSKYNQSLSLARLKSDDLEMYDQIVKSFHAVCEKVMNQECQASVNGKLLDEESQAQFRDEIQRLSDFLSMKSAD